MPLRVLPHPTPVPDWQRWSQIPIPTPLPDPDGWRQVPIVPRDEPLVATGPGSEFADLYTSGLYWGEHTNSPYAVGELDGALLTCFVRRGVALALREAQRVLPPHLGLVLFDGYRPVALQGALFTFYADELAKRHPDWSRAAVEEATQAYVSCPSADPAAPSPHLTGGAIDLAIYTVPGWDGPDRPEARIIQRDARLLEYGTAFDHGGPTAALGYFEDLGATRVLTPEEELARDNRRLLYWLLQHVGLDPIPSEWWHYHDRRTQMGVRTAHGGVATLGVATLTAEHRAWEAARQQQEALARQGAPTAFAAHRTTGFSLAERIAPP